MRTSVRTFRHTGVRYSRRSLCGNDSIDADRQVHSSPLFGALALSAENRNGTGPASRQLQEKVGGVAPAGLFSWFALEIARLLNSSDRANSTSRENAHLKSVAACQAPA
jgi:hypothetical protein